MRMRVLITPSRGAWDILWHSVQRSTLLLHSMKDTSVRPVCSLSSPPGCAELSAAGCLSPHVVIIPQVHGECVTIQTSFRPVPLRWVFAHKPPRSTCVLDDLLLPGPVPQPAAAAAAAAASRSSSAAAARPSLGAAAAGDGSPLDKQQQQQQQQQLGQEEQQQQQQMQWRLNPRLRVEEWVEEEIRCVHLRAYVCSQGVHSSHMRTPTHCLLSVVTHRKQLCASEQRHIPLLCCPVRLQHCTACC
jgi:hypothetical protein